MGFVSKYVTVQFLLKKTCVATKICCVLLAFIFLYLPRICLVLVAYNKTKSHGIFTHWYVKSILPAKN